MWAPDRYAAMYANTKGLREPGFYGMISHIDANMARLGEFLDKRGLRENTILIFTTDNGTAAGAGVFNAGMRGAKGSPYEGGHRVPFFVSWPKGRIGGGRDIGKLTAHVDVLPTLMDYCGLQRPAGPPMDGRSLKPLLEEKDPQWPDRALMVDSQRVERLVKWRQGAVMTEEWRLVNPSPDGDPARLELYAIRQDPSQQKNVADANPRVVERLLAAYDACWNRISPGSEEPVRIVIGNPAANPVRLTAHDWHSEGAERAWNQGSIRQAPVANGPWTLRVERPGTYRFALRRWPEETGLAINAPYQDREPNREKRPGNAIQAVSARMRIGAVERAAPVGESDQAAVFEVRLNAGPADLQTWFRDASGTERGAYYVYVTRLG